MCKVKLKKLGKLPAVRNSDRVVNLRKEKIEVWEATPTWTFAKTVCSSTKYGLICTHKETMVALGKGCPPKALYRQRKV
jgi:hypothetical protein